MNFPIQSMIADAVAEALHHLYNYRSAVGCPDMYRILLQVHDALIVEAPYRYARHVADEVLPYCMSKCVPIFPTRLDGAALKRGPYYLGTEVGIYRDWGETLTVEACQKYGIPETLAA